MVAAASRWWLVVTWPYVWQELTFGPQDVWASPVPGKGRNEGCGPLPLTKVRLFFSSPLA